MVEFNLSSTKLNEIQNHDDFRVAWFSSNNNYPNELTYFVDYLEKCDSFETCDNYIKRFQSERKILLVLIDSSEYLSYFNDLPQIQSIYVLDRNLQNIQCSKLVNIFTDELALIERIRQDILLTYRNDLPITISCLDEIKTEQSLMSLDKNTFFLLWNQLFMYCLVNSSDTDMDNLKKNMIEQCQLEYHDNQVQLADINNFANHCTSDNVLNWYTQNKFAYRLLNKAFRKRNIDLICKFRYFIILLYNKLKELSMQQQAENYTTVYRGQILGKNELEILQSNVGHLISTNSMLSTSRNQNIARQFILGAEVGVIFEISTENANNNILHPFADISQFSSMPHEEEVLFFAGAVFRINSVEKVNDSIWIIKLTLSNEIVEQIEQFMNGIQQQLTYITCWDHLFMKIDQLILFGKYYKILTQKSFSWKDIMADVININMYRLLSILGDPQKVIEYYKELLYDQNFIDYPKFIVLNIIIGYNYSHLLEYDNTLLHYGIAFSLLDDNNKLTGELHIHIADVWRARYNFENALSCYEKALKNFIYHNVNDRNVARIYRKISDIHRKQNNSEVAIIYEEQADQIDQHYRQRSELDIETSLKYLQNQLDSQLVLPQLQRADVLYSMGLCFIKKSDYPQALEKLLQAKELYENHLPSYDNFVQIFSTLFDSIALVYLLLKDNFNALIMLKKAIDIRLSFNSN